MQRSCIPHVQAEKIDCFSCFSILSGLVQPGIIPAEFVQEARFPPYFEKLVRSLIKLWGAYMDFLERASPLYTAYLTWAMLDPREIIYFLPPIPINVFIPTSLLEPGAGYWFAFAV